MARDTVTYESYEQDAFDNPPKGPVGVHRGSRSVMVKIAPFIIVILVAVLCGFGVWAGISGEYKNFFGLSTSQNATPTKSDDTTNSGSTADSGTKGESATDGDSSADAATKDDSSGDSSSSAASNNNDSAAADQNAQQQANAAAAVNKATQVRVVNATGIAGYAGQKADALQAAGYTSVEASNPTGSVPASTVVWYQNETDKATADDVATTLGIASVEQVQGLAAPVTVVLLN
jgi:cytoskeletal protein RodZ